MSRILLYTRKIKPKKGVQHNIFGCENIRNQIKYNKMWGERYYPASILRLFLEQSVALCFIDNIYIFLTDDRTKNMFSITAEYIRRELGKKIKDTFYLENYLFK